MACCGQSNQSTPGAQPAAMTPAFNLASVPDSMILVEYTGTNVGSTLWGGAGATPSRRQYVFGANDADRVKYVDQVDVDYFLNVREYGKAQFKRYEEPAQTPPAGDEGDQKAKAPAGDEPAQDAPQAQQTGATVVDAGNMDKATDPGTTAHVADPLTASIVNPDAPTVTEEIKEEPLPAQPREVAPKAKATHKGKK